MERVESAAKEFFDPDLEPTDIRLRELAKIIFGEDLELNPVLQIDKVKAIREFPPLIGRNRNFAETAVFQTFLAETDRYKFWRDKKQMFLIVADFIFLSKWDMRDARKGSKARIDLEAYRPHPSLCMLKDADGPSLSSLSNEINML